jgi:hypothetical protein
MGRTAEEKLEAEERISEKLGLIFRVRWYRIILDEAQ